MHFRLFWLGLCPWVYAHDMKSHKIGFFFFFSSMVKARAFALELIQHGPKNVLQARSSPQHDSAWITNFLKWPCVETIALQEQLLLAPCDGQHAPSAPFAPQLIASQAATMSVLEVKAPVPWLRSPGKYPKSGICPTAFKWLYHLGNWVIPYSKMSVCFFPQGSLPLHLLLSPYVGYGGPGELQVAVPLHNMWYFYLVFSEWCLLTGGLQYICRHVTHVASRRVLEGWNWL